MKFKRNDKFSDRPERKRSAKEILLLETLRYWGFYKAASEMDIHRERVNIESALASWADYPKCLSHYPEVITKKRTYKESGAVVTEE